MATDLVPIGKYKGQPVTALAQDRPYCDWLTQQGWFVQKFPELHTLIVNNFGEPTETPEHNRLQLRFLDPEFVAKCSRAILDAFKPDNVDRSGWFLPMPTPEFEVEGIDVFWRIQAWDCEPKTSNYKDTTDLYDFYWRDVKVIVQEFDNGKVAPGKTLHWYHAEEGTSAYSKAVLDAKNVHDAIRAEISKALRNTNLCRCIGAYEGSHAPFCPEAKRIEGEFEERLRAAIDVSIQTREAHRKARIAALAALESRWEEFKPFFMMNITASVICPKPIPPTLFDGKSFAVECKPSLGDDYPAVLRYLKSLIGQTKETPERPSGHPINDCHKAVVIDQFSAQGGTLAQVKTFFRQAKILLLTVEEIEATEPLNNCEFAHFATCNVDGWLNEKAQTS